MSWTAFCWKTRTGAAGCATVPAPTWSGMARIGSAPPARPASRPF